MYNMHKRGEIFILERRKKMKKALAALLVLTFIVACCPGAVLAEKYKSKLLDKTLKLPNAITVQGEEALEDGSGVQWVMNVKNHSDEAITVIVQIDDSLNGYKTAALPQTVIDGWTESYYSNFPENAVAGRIPSNSGQGDALYCYIGQTAEGGCILVYTSVNDGVCLTSIGTSNKNGLSRITTQAVLEALNVVSTAIYGKTEKASVYSHTDYVLELEFLLLEEDDDIDLYDDDEFDWEYDEEDWDGEDLGDEEPDDADSLLDFDGDEEINSDDSACEDDDSYDDDSDYDDGGCDDDSDYDDGGYDDDSDYDDGGYDDYGDYDDGGYDDY